MIAYAYSTTLCARMKLYVLFGNLVLGVIGYVIVEIRHRRKVNHNKIDLLITRFAKILNSLLSIKWHKQERRLKKQEARENAAREAEAAKQQEIEETDDEKDDLEEDIEVTHF